MSKRGVWMVCLAAAMTVGVASSSFADGWGYPGDGDQRWRAHEWREQAWRQHEWRERAWRQHEWREHEWREHQWRYGAPVVVTPGYGYYTAPGYYR